MKKTTLLLFVMAFNFFCYESLAAPPPLNTVWQNFDAFPATGEFSIPQGAGTWSYSSNHTNTNVYIEDNGWWDASTYSTNIHNYFSYYFNTYNSSHMGFETYGYMEIDDKTSVNGNSLRLRVTGGKTLSDPNNDSSAVVKRGATVLSKEDALAYQASSISYIDSTSKVGMPYVYFMNTSQTGSFIAFPQAVGNNRMSFYTKMPDKVTNGTGGWGHEVQETIHIGPYNNVGGHWYDFVYIEGGKWAHILIDGHPQHNNAYATASDFPYPSHSIRDYGASFFNSMYRWYIAYLPYTGIDTPPYSVWIDEIGFVNDPEPQNNETINTLAVACDPQTKTFEISFNDKYVNNGYNYSTYEARYSFSPITNANWSAAKPVLVQSDARYGLTANTSGQFKKWNNYYRGVWAPFKIASGDESKFVPNTTIYFAVKDVSQINGDGATPAVAEGGRNYSAYASTFDYAGDKPALPLIKRIDFYFSEKMLSGSTPAIKSIIIK